MNMKRRLDAFLCVLVAAASVCAANETAAIRKCCPADQQLSPLLESCVPASGSDADATSLWWLDPALANNLPSDVAFRFGRGLPCDRFDMLYVPTFFADRFALAPDGALKLRVRGGSGGGNDVGAAPEVTLPPEDFCTDRVDATPSPTRANTFVLLACPCAHAVCVRKCCALSQVYAKTKYRKEEELKCDNSLRDEASAPWSPEPFFSDDDGGGGAGGSGGGAYFLLSKTGLRCLPGEASVWVEPTSASASSSSSASALKLFRNGSAAVGGFSFAGAVTRFCGERLRLALDDHHDGAAASASAASASMDGVRACVPRSSGDASASAAVGVGATDAVNGALFVVGAVFLLLTLCVHALLPDLRRRAHTRAALCHVAALLAGALTQAAGQLRAHMPLGECYAVAFVVQFSFLAAFFWLNVMCIDIAWAFSGVRPLGERDRRKFLCYSVYAWGCPAAITAITALLEFAEGLPDALVRPNIGERNCWFYSKMATLAYFYGPMAALLLANLFLFVYTAARIVRAQKDTAMLQRGENSRHTPRGDTKRLVLYLKLFCLMGVTWVFEIISWTEGSDSLYWYVTDSINMLRGVFIFVLFCCKPKVLKLLLRRLRELGLYSDACEESVCTRWRACSRLCCCWGGETNNTSVSHVGANGAPVLGRNRSSNATTSTFMSRSSGITLQNSILSRLFSSSSVAPMANVELASLPTSVNSTSTVTTEKEITFSSPPEQPSVLGTRGDDSESPPPDEAAGSFTANHHTVTQANR